MFSKLKVYKGFLDNLKKYNFEHLLTIGPITKVKIPSEIKPTLKVLEFCLMKMEFFLDFQI